MQQFIVEIDDTDMKVLEYVLLDVNEWIQESVRGKINNCYKRAIAAESLLNVQKMTAEDMKVEAIKLTLEKRSEKEYKDKTFK